MPRSCANMSSSFRPCMLQQASTSGSSLAKTLQSRCSLTGSYETCRPSRLVVSEHACSDRQAQAGRVWKRPCRVVAAWRAHMRPVGQAALSFVLHFAAHGNIGAIYMVCMRTRVYIYIYICAIWMALADQGQHVSSQGTRNISVQGSGCEEGEGDTAAKSPFLGS